MKNFFSCGGFSSFFSVGKTPQNAFEKHGLLSTTQGVQDFMRNLFSFLISLVVTSTLRASQKEGNSFYGGS